LPEKKKKAAFSIFGAAKPAAEKKVVVAPAKPVLEKKDPVVPVAPVVLPVAAKKAEPKADMFSSMFGAKKVVPAKPVVEKTAPVIKPPTRRRTSGREEGRSEDRFLLILLRQFDCRTGGKESPSQAGCTSEQASRRKEDCGEGGSQSSTNAQVSAKTCARSPKNSAKGNTRGTKRNDRSSQLVLWHSSEDRQTYPAAGAHSSGEGVPTETAAIQLFPGRRSQTGTAGSAEALPGPSSQVSHSHP
jgi:hypothetical protein